MNSPTPTIVDGRPVILVPHEVITVRALGRGRFETVGRIRFNDKLGAVRTANQLQASFDEDCEPCRAYVVNKDGLPIIAGGAATCSSMESLRNNDG